MTERTDGIRKTAAVVMVTLLTGIIVLAAGQFLGWFQDVQRVTLYAPRAGLVMSPDAKVKLRGVEVGRVAAIRNDGERAILDLDMSTRDLSKVPANVQADIKSNTIFGAKSVNLVIPEQGAVGRLTGGATIRESQVVVELNTVYQQLVQVLATLEPEKLSVTLGAVSGALSGNGQRLGEALSALDHTLGEVEPHLPALNRLFAEAAGGTNVYADAMPNLMRVVDNSTVLGNLLVENTANLDALLINVTGMAGTGDKVLAASKKDLMSTLTDLNPVTKLLGYQAPGLRCFIVGASNAADMATPLLGGRNGMLLLDSGLIPGQDPYRYPQDLPRVGAEGPPTCEGGLGDIDSKERIKFYVTDNAPQPYQPRTQPKVQPFKLFNLLFGGPQRG
ncbi:Mce family protein [Gordonia hirsuta DSM 44140 = NBRC 16056]|uniref:Mce family protein n=1 Tax=Gordonia hirsuta DSM 44140 = NBRC 16056 TaxID=1121927 RepID=L7LCT5_9ACTN|nr:MCE family protein [Gordonia hirsuta]GAC57887.1 Mce family protein [Gordonia hirsuta DSM 44140 = NBRC 16056]